jgi:UPF0755 protein
MIGGILVDEGVVKSTKAWSQAVDSEERATSVQAGSYLMKKQMPAIDALRLLINPGGSRVRTRFTVPEGLRLTDQLTVLGQGHQGEAVCVPGGAEEAEEPGPAQVREEEARRSAVPETYELTAEATATSTLQQMVSQYKTVTRDIGFEAVGQEDQAGPVRRADRGQHHREGVNKEQYRAKVARVLYNRLAKDRKLELDSTVAYAEKLKTNTTTPKDRASRSRYNTYRIPGPAARTDLGPGQGRPASCGSAGARASGCTSSRSTSTPVRRSSPTPRPEFNKIKAEFQTWCKSNPGRCDS